ncbi:MAG TPA: tetratricopeptide repeat protein [Syntrophales bacterium]|jgi:tetratricopeptide (TPR) repeat protein|nr:tetratricopeptide repeat protein [Deltaproteobacteria bacterium]HNZ35686.1 tetratricopeptide repeat protein [Syntrophales bacterium]
MDYYKKEERRERRQRREKTGRPMILVGAALIGVLILVGAVVLIAVYGEIFTVKGIRGFVRVNLLGKTPAFHYMDIERNGKEERVTAAETFTITYRDEFIVKSVSTDSLFEKNITVDVDGLGGANDLKVLLKAVELVDATMTASVKEALRGRPLPQSAIRVRYNQQEIGVVPVRIELTPQDWLRFARNPANAKWQAQALEKALAMNPDDTALRKTLAEQHLETGKIDQAIAQYRAVLSRKADDMTALAGLSRCYVERKDYARALPLTRRITELNPKDAGAHAIAGFLYGKMGKWNDAVTHYGTSLKLKPDDAMVRFSLGGAYEKTGKLAPAIREYETAHKRMPDDQRVTQALADAYRKAGREQDAAKLYATLARKNTKDPNAYAALAQAHGRKGQVKEEIENYRKAIAAQPRDPILRYNLGVAYDKAKRHKEALAEYEKALQLKPDDTDAAARISEHYFRGRRYREAVEALNRIRKTAPKNPRVYADLGFAYGELKQYRDAEENYKKALQLGSSDPNIHLNLAAIYEKQGRTKEAAKAVEKGSKSGKATTEALERMGAQQMKAKQYDAALKTYRQLAAVESRRGLAYANMGTIYGIKGQTEKAIENLKLAVRYDKEDEGSWFALGEAYEKKKMYKEALEAYKAAYQINPESRAAERIPQLRIRMLEDKHRE